MPVGLVPFETQTVVFDLRFLFARQSKHRLWSERRALR